MNVAGISIVKNEDDVIEHTIRHMLTQVDFVIVIDNGSTDSTYDILESLAQVFPDTVYTRQSIEPFNQSDIMSALAQEAGEKGAQWVVPFDADEIWFCLEGEIRHLLMGARKDLAVVSATLYDHYGTSMDLAKGSPFERLVWKKKLPGALPKVACRVTPDLIIDHGNHSARYKYLPHIEKYPIEIRHFPYRSPEHMVRKAVNGSLGLKSAGLNEAIGGHWHGYAKMVADHGEEALHDWYRQYFWFADPENQGLVRDPAPIQRRENEGSINSGN